MSRTTRSTTATTRTENRDEDERGTYEFNARDQLTKWTKASGKVTEYELNGDGAIPTPPAADPSSLDAIEPFVAECAERRASVGELGEVVSPLGCRREPDEDLAAVFRGLAPYRLARRRVPPAAAPGGLAATPRFRICECRARLGVGDVDARESRLPPVRHDPSSGGARKVAPGDRRGTGLSETEGFAGVRWGREHPTDSARNSCTVVENGQLQRCRRRDSNPRHADYDSAALTD
jgi:hypothetical protein